MTPFLTENDYNALVKAEIKTMLLHNEQAFTVAEYQALGQMRQYLAGKYDIDAALSESAEGRDFFLVMICLDLTLYHLYCAFAPKQIPKHREDRYEDALNWLKKAGSGELPAQLPLREGPHNNTITVSSYDKQDHRF